MAREIRFWFTVLGGAVAIAAAGVVWYAAIYLNTGGHPPPSGIVAMFAVLVATPFSVLALLLSLLGATMSSRVRTRSYLTCLGIHALFLVLAVRMIFF